MASSLHQWVSNPLFPDKEAVQDSHESYMEDANKNNDQILITDYTSNLGIEFGSEQELDAAKQLTNIFWADTQMIVDYELFGNVVSFNMIYKTNKEYRLLAMFVGFNHHREVVIFRAAFLYNETIQSFEWLFETFFEAVSRKKPNTIFTDQDLAMAKAISLVMPNTYHRLCT
ncbi:protein FAR1-RELATED SEQUENCE 5-like [Alnus glutinosa]|uniref:protein FAR1-RELATED SEQUENCE 5-like n=1 Tax=Alnus glutinosa TaxID=3517 RepID=UPI002D778BEB|nr:protein FAR1-RELATED SEQUENCE 5-like [Alnus glutinosa]